MSSKSIIPIALLAIGYAPLLFLHFLDISQQQQYQYWPFVLAAMVYMLWARSGHQPHADNGPPRYVWLLFVIAFIMLLAGGALFAPWCAAMSAVVATGAVFLTNPSIRNTVNACGIWLLGWLMIPPPFGLDGKLVRSLQGLSSLASSQVLDLMGVNHLMAGNALEVPGKQFFVDEACSGIVSVMSIITVGAIYVVWANRSFFHSAALIGTGIVWAVIMNIGRIVTIAVAFEWFNIDLSKGAPHDMLGLALFMVTFTALASTDQLLQLLMAKIEFGIGGREAEANPLIRTWNRFTSIGDPLRGRSDGEANKVGAGDPVGTASEGMTTPAPAASEGNRVSLSPIYASAFALVGLTMGGLLCFGAMRSGSTLSEAQKLSEATLPASLNAWQKVDYKYEHREDNELFGEFSNTFTYALNDSKHSVVVSFDYPFPAQKGWKELSVCYKSIGWKMVGRQIVSSQSKDGLPWNFVRVEFEKDSQRGHLCFGHFDGTGDPISPPKGSWNQALWTRARRFKGYTQSPHLFQSQAWLVTDGELTAELEQQLREIYLESREIFRGSMQSTTRVVAANR